MSQINKMYKITTDNLEVFVQASDLPELYRKLHEHKIDFSEIAEVNQEVSTSNLVLLRQTIVNNFLKGIRNAT